MIDQHGRLQKVYLTTMAYASTGQAAQILAEEAASLLPGHPKLASQRSLAYISGIGPSARALLPAAAGGPVTLGPGRPHLLLFFATWLAETSDLRAQLTALNGYARAARREGLPRLVAVDEAATEPAPSAARTFLAHLGRPLSYPDRPGHDWASRRRVRRAGPAVVRAHLRLRKDRLEERRLAPRARPQSRRPQSLTHCPGLADV